VSKVMYDSTNPGVIPIGAQLVASYVDGFGGYSEAVARFGSAKVVSISVQNNNADVADVETGAMTPADLPGWLARQYARGLKRPVVYCNQSTWPSVRKVMGTNTRVSYWIAAPGNNGTYGPATLPGADAVQNLFAGKFDTSVVQPTFPFYDAPSPVPVPPKPVPKPTSGTQAGWLWCNKCSGLFFGAAAGNVCPAGGKHVGTASWKYDVGFNNA
jgi:hypothetical protein